MGGKVPAAVGFCSVMSSGKFWFGNNLPSCPARGLLKARQQEQRKKAKLQEWKLVKENKNPNILETLRLSYSMLHDLRTPYLSEKNSFLTF